MEIGPVVPVSSENNQPLFLVECQKSGSSGPHSIRGHSQVIVNFYSNV
jgi:hypothetical protein